jgi:hypothetical protein
MNTVTDDFDEINPDIALLCSPEADEFAKALDRQGWMIVTKSPNPPPERWFLNEPADDCPEWADNEPPEDDGEMWNLREQPKPKPTLYVIDGGKPPNDDQ